MNPTNKALVELAISITDHQTKLTKFHHEAFLAALRECEEAHRENGDEIGADAIKNAIEYAEQETSGLF